MPQHLLNVSAANAKLRFGVVIADNPPPLSDENSTMPAPQGRGNFEITHKETENSQSTTIKRVDEEPPPQNGADLF
jgi:hypothetical protein